MWEREGNKRDRIGQGKEGWLKGRTSGKKENKTGIVGEWIQRERKVQGWTEGEGGAVKSKSFQNLFEMYPLLSH